MKFYSIVLPATVIVSGICLAVAFLPSFLGPLGAAENVLKRKKLKNKKRAREKRRGPVYVIHKDTDGYLTEDFIPEIEHQTGLKTVTAQDADQIGRYIFQVRQELVEQSSVILVWVTEDLIKDPWVPYDMSLCLQQNADSVFLVFDEKLNLENLPSCFQDAVAIGCKTIKVCTEQFKDPGALAQVAEKISQNLTNDDVSLIPAFPTEFKDVVFQHETFVVHDIDDSLFCHQVACALFDDSVCSAIFTPGKFEHQSYSAAIQSSKNIAFILTPKTLKLNYFQFQIRLALRYKKRQFITFVVTKNVLNHLPDNAAFRYAIATCRKIYRN